MKKKSILFIVFLFSQIHTFAQNEINSKSENEPPQIILSITIPLGSSGFITNLYKRFGIYTNILYKNGKGIDDGNYLSPYHELVSNEVIGRTSFAIGSTFRLWKPFHLYGGIGLGWKTRQLIYKDTPPIVFSDVYMTLSEDYKATMSFGLICAIKKVCLGFGYDTLDKRGVFTLGFVIGGIN